MCQAEQLDKEKKYQASKLGWKMETIFVADGLMRKSLKDVLELTNEFSRTPSPPVKIGHICTH
jgi:hypothetical protein